MSQEIVVINDKTLIHEIPESHRINNLVFPQKHCIFEYIYFSRPDSFIFGHNVDKMRRRLGKVLARKHPVRDRDGEKVIVISVPTVQIQWHWDIKPNLKSSI
ncbi:MAG: hypothetical protein MZV64_37980 [Ignavibacteriales bacterium]|nr:hypothetical protein [Ignavibacteriales bacterium]